MQTWVIVLFTLAFVVLIFIAQGGLHFDLDLYDPGKGMIHPPAKGPCVLGYSQRGGYCTGVNRHLIGCPCPCAAGNP